MKIGNGKKLDYEKHVSAYIKGQEGEEHVSDLLRNRGVRTIDNVYLKLGGKTTQIDKIILTPRGISLLEIKNQRDCIITGDLRKRYWSASYYGKKHRIYSPFMQNLSHICKLKTYIKDSRLYFYNFVLYSDNVKLHILNDGKDLTNNEYRCVNKFKDIDAICNYGDANYSERDLDILEREFRKLKSYTDRYAIEHLRQIVGRFD